MAKARKSSASKSKSGGVFAQWAQWSWLAKANKAAAGQGEGPIGRIYVFASEQAIKDAGLKKWAPDWVQSWLEQAGDQSSHRFTSDKGAVWLLRPYTSGAAPAHTSGHNGRLETSGYQRVRDVVGAAVVQSEEFPLSELQVHFLGCNDEEVLGGLVAIEMAAYRYLRVQKSGLPPKTLLRVLRDETPLKDKDLAPAIHLGLSINLARHLVNMPANELNPKSYSEAIADLFAKSTNVKVDIWDPARLQKEKMGLMLAVGGGAAQGPRLVHMRYRPKGAKGRPVAFVGKGITFDSGGLDIKPPSGMRWMKKDMGGSAAVVGLCYWLDQSGLNVPCDFYVALAENAIDKNSFRPGDVVQSRSGRSVEIHNTDAEGRLVLADALDVAVTQKGAHEPGWVIDVATLTGAIKVGLGSELAGLFATDDDLAAQMEQAAVLRGDLCWRMPLFQKYRRNMNSVVADMTNAVDGFGGAVTAALFLESFTGGKPWAHWDIYAWKEGCDGPWAEAGGNGQAVAALAAFLKNWTGK